MIRSLLYVPANSERFVAKAHERGADAILLDLEDAVIASEKANARAALATAVPMVSRNGALCASALISAPRDRPQRRSSRKLPIQAAASTRRA